jgi:hypothetical protein
VRWLDAGEGRAVVKRRARVIVVCLYSSHNHAMQVSDDLVSCLYDIQGPAQLSTHVKSYSQIDFTQVSYASL